MKRYMDLVRSILMKVADSDRPVTIEELADEEHDKQLVGYHISIMNDAGLIKASLRSADNDSYYFCSVSSLTWEGNDFLDTVRSDTVWENTKSTISKTVGSTTFEIVKSVAAKISTAMLMSQLGM